MNNNNTTNRLTPRFITTWVVAGSLVACVAIGTRNRYLAWKAEQQMQQQMDRIRVKSLENMATIARNLNQMMEEDAKATAKAEYEGFCQGYGYTIARPPTPGEIADQKVKSKL